MLSIYKTNFFSNEMFAKIKNFVLDSIEKDSSFSYANSFKRYYGIALLPKEIMDPILSMAKKQIGDESLEIAYSQIIKYQIKDGVYPELPKHKDSVTGEWVMDIVIDGTLNWPLIVEDQSFDNFPNSVIFIRGEDEFHERPKFPSNDDSDYLILLFVHLAKQGSEYLRVSQEIFSMKDEDLSSFLKAAKPAWGY